MWKTLIFQDNYYLFRVISTDGMVTIHLTDLQNVWKKNTSINNLTQLFKDLNPLLVQDAEEINNSCLSILKESLIESLTFNDNSHDCNLKFKHFFEELPLKLDITLEKQAGTDFFKQVTIPIVQTVQYLEFKQKKLETLLMQKDKELSEYKLEYGKITRQMLETETYEADTDIKANLVLKVFSGDENFNKVFAEKHGDVQQLYPEVKEQKKAEKRKLQLAPTKYKKLK